MPDILSSINTRSTPQRERATPTQVQNSAKGYVFVVTDETRLRRFLTIGTEGGTFYASAKDLTKDNAEVVLRLAVTATRSLVDTVVEISEAGRAPKQNQALFALAAAASLSDADGKAYALAVLPRVARTATHLFQFLGYVQQFRGWGPGLRKAVAAWYLSKPVDDLAYQMVKYRNREGWTHRDVLRKAHVKTVETERNALFRWAVKGEASDDAPDLVGAFRALNADTIPLAQAVDIIGAYPISHEMLPDRFKSEPAVWEALLAKGMPITALIRQLPTLTRVGVLTGETRKAVAARLSNPEILAKGRVHPLNVLVAQRTYQSGQGDRGHSTWTPNRVIVDALDAAFYAAYGAVEPTGKRTLLALDVSGSMGSRAGGLPLTAREVAAAMALVTANVEDEYDIVGFTSQGGYNSSWRTNAALTPLAISPRQRIDDVTRYTASLPFGGTDCGLPMRWAKDHGGQYDTFVIYTDNETWAGPVHPFQALRQYREATGISARLATVGVTSTGFTIADPNDAGMLDVVGFDSAAPGLISDFARGL